MKTLVLFGGGESGGLLMTDNGVRAIQPLAPAIRQTLRSAGIMVNAAAIAESDGTRKKIGSLATSLCNLAVQQVEEVVGPLDADHSLIFQHQDGGFICGATGKPPIPLAWPPPSVPALQDLIAAGAVDRDVIELLRRARDKGVKLTQVFERPAETADELGVTLSAKSVKDLAILAPCRLADVKDDDGREIIAFFHKVVEDGRFVETWLKQPYEVARTLKVDLGDAALDRLLTGGALSVHPDVAKVSPIVLGVTATPVVAVVVILGFTKAPHDVIEDRSGLEKL